MSLFAVFYFILVFLLFGAKKSKAVPIVSFIYLAILFVFSEGVADRHAYEYALANGSTRSMEIGWVLFLQIMKSFHCSTLALCFIIGIPYLLTLFYVVPKISQNNRAVACYMIGLFFLDVVQLRYTLSLIFVWWALYFFFSQESKFAFVQYIALIIVASLFHSSNIVFLLFACSKISNKKTLFVITLVILFCLFIGFNFFAPLVSQLFSVEETFYRIYGQNERVTFHAILANVVYLIALFLLMSSARYNLDRPEKDLLYGTNISILSVVFVPLTFFSNDFRRHIFVIALFLIALFYKHEDKYRDELLFLFPVFLVLCFFVRSSLSGNKYSVFDPIFSNNILFNIVQVIF